MTRQPEQQFLIEPIKPSHYDGDGNVIRWWRGSVPSNSLSSLYGLALNARNRHTLSDCVALEVTAGNEPMREFQFAA
jgi:hypothetical protein